MNRNEVNSIGSAETTGGDTPESLGRIDQYDLLRELGGGGFGTVYLAKDAVAGIEVAVKGLPPLVKHNREELERIRQNFALVARLHHPNIAAALTLHPARDVWYADEATRCALRVESGDMLMVMEYAPGVTLGSWRRQFSEGRVPVEQALEVCRQTALALDYAHSEKIIHRDVKPSNLMVETHANGTLRVRVLDFGLAAEIRSSMSRVSQEQGDTSGTRPYMAPEQWSGRKQAGYTDQYALAALFYELVSGEVPFASAFDTGDPVIMSNAAINLRPEALLMLSKAQNAALLRAMAKEPSERFASCADFVAALGGGKISSRRRGERGGKKGVGYSVLGIRYWVLGVGVAAVVLGIGYSVLGIGEKRERDAAAARARQEQMQLDAVQQAKMNELEKAVDAALTAGELQEAGAKIAELAGMSGEGETVTRLRKAYEAKAGERETNKRYADASLAHERAMKFDPGQTLDAKQEELECKWREAEAARQGKSWEQALSAYDEVIAKGTELEKLDVAREASKTQSEAADTAKKNAEKADAATYATELFKGAEALMAKAVESFGNGQFDDSAKQWSEAAGEYGKAERRSLVVQGYNQAKAQYDRAAAPDLTLLKANGGKLWTEVDRQARLGGASAADPATGTEAYAEALSGLPAAVAEAKAAEKSSRLNAALAEAQAAKVREDWPTVMTSADKALEIDAGNAEAAALKREAEGNLEPTLTILAQTEDGREVSAEVGDGRKTWKTAEAVKLREGENYAFTVSNPSNSSNPSKRYQPAVLVLTADWRGPQTHRVTLEEIKGPAAGEPWTVPDLGLVLMPVAAGSFRMGSEDGHNDEKPVRTVRITRDFWMGKTEVTQAEYRKVTGKSPSNFKGDDLPVETVSWEDAVRFCEELTRRERTAGRLPQGYLYRLPTEAEWEYAARGGSKSRGFTYSGNDDLGLVGRYDANSESKTHPVGQKLANELGIVDMSGNVWEWCADWYQDSYSGLSDADSEGPTTGSFRVFRGGGWDFVASLCRSASRYRSTPSHAYDVVGVRVVLAAPVQ